MADIKSKDDGQGDLSPEGKTDKTVEYWNRQIERYNRAFKEWKERASKIVRIYTDERRIDTTAASSPRKLAILWSNISTLQPAVYARLPHPSVSRRYKDADPVARTAGEIIERAVSYIFDKEGVDDVVKMVRDDYLLAGRGTVWLRYEAEFEPIIGPDGEPMKEPPNPKDPKAEPAPMEKISKETVKTDFVPYADFGHTPARNWQEVTAVWRATYLPRSKIKARFGAEIAEKITLDFKGSDDPANNHPLEDGDKKATIYEIWDRETKKVYFISPSYPTPLEVVDPFLKLDGFFPCPKPVYGTLQELSLVPVPDYVFYQDQVEEVDELTNRIGKLTEALKLVGFYPQGPDSTGSSAIEKALAPGTDMRMIPVPGWAAFAEKGGANQIVWLPVDMVEKVLRGCIELRKQLIEDIYQVTGISDIIRGESNPNETATAQQIKGQWGSIRIRDRQSALARFIGDMAQIAGEIVAEKFQPETLMEMTNVKLPSRQEIQQQQLMAQQAAMMQAQAAQQQQQPTMPPQGGPPAPGPQGAPVPPQPQHPPMQPHPAAPPHGGLFPIQPPRQMGMPHGRR